MAKELSEMTNEELRRERLALEEESARIKERKRALSAEFQRRGETEQDEMLLARMSPEKRERLKLLLSQTE